MVSSLHINWALPFRPLESSGPIPATIFSTSSSKQERTKLQLASAAPKVCSSAGL